jgi:hypothetical protein
MTVYLGCFLSVGAQWEVESSRGTRVYIQEGYPSFLPVRVVCVQPGGVACLVAEVVGRVSETIHPRSHCWLPIKCSCRLPPVS